MYNYVRNSNIRDYLTDTDTQIKKKYIFIKL